MAVHALLLILLLPYSGPSHEYMEVSTHSSAHFSLLFVVVFLLLLGAYAQKQRSAPRKQQQQQHLHRPFLLPLPLYQL